MAVQEAGLASTLPSTPAGGPTPSPPPGVVPAAPPLVQGPTPSIVIPESDTKDWDRTRTGLWLAFIGLLLLWIPYVEYLGFLLLFIGFIFLFVGRYAFGEPHRRSVVLGAALILVSLIGAFFLGSVFAGELLTASLTSLMPGVSIARIGAQLSSDFTFFILAGVVFGALVFLGAVFLIYRLANPSTRKILWAALIAGIGVSATVGAIVATEVSSVIAQATSSGTLNLTPLTTLQTTDTLLGLSNVLPYGLFAWAYYRTLFNV